MSQLRVLLACEMSGRVRHEFFKENWDAWSADILPDESVEYGSGRPVQTVHAGREIPAHRARYYKRRAAGVGIERHYQGDVRDLFDWDHPVNADRKAHAAEHPGTPLWDLIIAFPPCFTAGNRWRAQKQADGREDEGAAFFMEMTEAPAPFIAIENPRGVMFSRFRKPDQEVQPYFFGDPFRKTTCFWLEGAFKLPLLIRTDECEPESTASSGDMSGYRFGTVVTQGGTYRNKHAGRANHYEDSRGRKNRAKVRSLTFPGLARALASQWGEYVKERNGAE